MQHRSVPPMAWSLVATAFAFGTEVAAQGPPPPATWDVTVGAVTQVVPRYSGSDQYRVMPFPMAQVTFRNRVYLGPSATSLGGALGGYLIRTSSFDFSAEVGFGDERPASRADALAGMEDRDMVVSAGGGLRFRAGPLEATLGGSRGFNDGAGTLGTARVTLSGMFGRLIASGGLGAVVADERQMRREFGVTQAEAARRQILIDAGDDRLGPDDGRAYRPAGGLRSVAASASLVYVISPRWSLIGFGRIDRLSDEAVASPLVRRRVQYSGGVGLGFRIPIGR
jgi:MipA family protein